MHVRSPPGLSVYGLEDLWDDAVPIHQTGYLTDMLGNRTVDVINNYAKSRQPFLLSLHFNAPHWPWEAPGDEAESQRLAQPGSGGIFDFDGGSQKTYQRMIEAMDRQIGRVLQALDVLRSVNNSPQHRRGIRKNDRSRFGEDQTSAKRLGATCRSTSCCSPPSSTAMAMSDVPAADRHSNFLPKAPLDLRASGTDNGQ